jgi:hypothetical protein
MRHRVILLCTFFAPSIVFAQQRYGASGFLQRLDDDLFHDCARIKEIALQSTESIHDSVYNLVLVPQSSASAFFSFPSDSSTAMPIKWLATYRSDRLPIASFYSVGPEYSFHCRDSHNRLVNSSGPEGDPLQLNLTDGGTYILHFSLFGKRSARVMIVTNSALDTLNGEMLLTEVTRRLDARFVYLYVRNDPWFLGYSSDTLPYVFTDGVRRLTEAEYRATRTMVCETDRGCKLVPSLYQ